MQICMYKGTGANIYVCMYVCAVSRGPVYVCLYEYQVCMNLCAIPRRGNQ